MPAVVNMLGVFASYGCSMRAMIHARRVRALCRNFMISMTSMCVRFRAHVLVVLCHIMIVMFVLDLRG